MTVGVIRCRVPGVCRASRVWFSPFGLPGIFTPVVPQAGPAWDFDTVHAAHRVSGDRGTTAEEGTAPAHGLRFLPSASDARGRQGIAQVLNRSAEAGKVRIVAVDDSGRRYGPLTLSIGANETAHVRTTIDTTLRHLAMLAATPVSPRSKSTRQIREELRHKDPDFDVSVRSIQRSLERLSRLFPTASEKRGTANYWNGEACAHADPRDERNDRIRAASGGGVCQTDHAERDAASARSLIPARRQGSWRHGPWPLDGAHRDHRMGTGA